MNEYTDWLGNCVLREHGYEIYSRPNGILALQTAAITILDFDWQDSDFALYQNDFVLYCHAYFKGEAWRLYRTRNGYRLFVDMPYAPERGAFKTLVRDLAKFELDASYLRVSALRGACAARLTPKSAITREPVKVCEFITGGWPEFKDASAAFIEIMYRHDNFTCKEEGILA